MYTWLGCEPVILQQQTSGILCGGSKPNFAVDDSDIESASLDGMPDGNVMTLVEVLCELSRNHRVDWELAHDYEPDLIGRICAGVADADLMEQLETLESIGDLLEDFEDDEAYELETSQFGLRDYHAAARQEDDRDDDGPRLLKFPGA